MSARRPKARLTLQQHQDALNDALNGHARPNDHLDQSDVYMVFCALIDSAEMVNYLRASIAELEAERDAAITEIERLREHEARARWCEERKAQVSWSITDQTWRVLWYSEACELRQTSHADRNAAIDAARGKL
jgi:hypothetical protein